LKDQALGVFVSEVSSPFDRVRRFIADGLVQASGSAPGSAQARIRSPVHDGNVLRSERDALGIAGEAGPVDRRMPANVVSDAVLDDPDASGEIRRCPDHGSSTNATGMWSRA
jgi:hypothetical protein